MNANCRRAARNNRDMETVAKPRRGAVEAVNNYSTANNQGNSQRLSTRALLHRKRYRSCSGVMNVLVHQKTSLKTRATVAGPAARGSARWPQRLSFNAVLVIVPGDV